MEIVQSILGSFLIARRKDEIKIDGHLLKPVEDVVEGARIGAVCEDRDPSSESRCVRTLIENFEHASIRVQRLRLHVA